MVRYIADPDNDALTLQEAAPKAYLILLVGGRVSQSFPLRGEIHLGRDKSNSVVVSDQKVSRHHASLLPVDEAYIITDKGSANGTYLNGVLITQPIRLKDKDRIGLGDTHFIFTNSLPDSKAIEQLVSSAPSLSVQIASANQPSSLGFPALNTPTIWILVGCLGLVIVGLLIILALVFGLFIGSRQVVGMLGWGIWLAQIL